jgi:iron complex transport system ATP-binding protein
VNAVEVRGLAVERGGRPIVDDVSLAVEASEWLCVIGPNGAGKSTLLRAVAGLIESTGEVRLGGISSTELSRRELAQRVALVPQNPLLPIGMRVFDYVLLGRTAHIPVMSNESRRDIDAVRDALDALALEDLGGRTLETLSGGEQQRAVLARALAQAAPILLLDEPTAALDLGHQQDVLELVDRLRRERALAVVSTMHDLNLASQFADRLLLLAGGRAVQTGTIADVLTEENIRRYYRARVKVVRIDGELHVVADHRPTGSA